MNTIINTQEIHYCENPSCNNNVAIKRYKFGWCCSTRCALALAATHANHKGKCAKGHHKCNKCNLEFQTWKELRLHKIDIHYGNEIYTCICGKQFNSKRSLGVHKQSCKEILKINGQLLEKYICNGCKSVFKSRASLFAHASHCEKYRKIKRKQTKYLQKDFSYKCECGKSFIACQSLLAHFSWCSVHKHTLQSEQKTTDQRIRRGNESNFSKTKCGKCAFNELHKKCGKALHANIQSGKTIPTWKGRHHTEETKEKMRRSTIRYLENVVSSRPRYNKSAISVLESIAKEHGWNIQHAENGGEFYTGIGYFVDAYDKDKNIVLEYDEPAHYVDAENNVLREKDVKRQQRIIDHLHCEYWRYNEKTGKLWKVD